MKKAGCLGNAAFDVTSKLSDNGKDKDIAMLQGRLEEMKAEKDKDGDRIAELEREAGMVADDSIDYRDEIADLKKEVKALKKELKK